MGDLPVPPTAKLPTQISGKLNLAELRYCLSNSQLRILIKAPYKTASGNNKTRKEVRKMVLKFIDATRRNEVVQRYVKLVCICYLLNRVKIGKSHTNDPQVASS